MERKSTLLSPVSDSVKTGVDRDTLDLPSWEHPACPCLLPLLEGANLKQEFNLAISFFSAIDWMLVYPEICMLKFQFPMFRGRPGRANLVRRIESL